MPNETIPVDQIIKLAEVKSALIFLGDRTAPGLLGVVAQSSGFKKNFTLYQDERLSGQTTQVSR